MLLGAVPGPLTPVPARRTIAAGGSPYPSQRLRAYQAAAADDSSGGERVQIVQLGVVWMEVSGELVQIVVLEPGLTLWAVPASHDLRSPQSGRRTRPAWATLWPPG